MAKKTEKPVVEKSIPPIPVRFKKLDPEAVIPQYKSAGAAGFDLNVIIKGTIPAGLAGNNAVTTIRGTILKPGETRILDTGLAVAVPAGYELQVRPRSGLAANQKCTVLNSPGTVDSDYRGEIKIILTNLNPDSVLISHGDRIAQGVIAIVPSVVILEVDELDATERGDGKFGSTGVK